MECLGWEIIESVTKRIKSISVGCQLGMLLDHRGILWSFGRNSFGELGHGDCNNRLSPCQIHRLTKVQVSSGSYLNLVLDSHS